MMLENWMPLKKTLEIESVDVKWVSSINRKSDFEF